MVQIINDALAFTTLSYTKKAADLDEKMRQVIEGRNLDDGSRSRN